MFKERNKKMMVETTYKLQRLNIAKAYLQNWFKNSLQFLSDSKYWRDSFEDQLKSDYKEHLISGISQLLMNESNGREVCSSIWDTKIDEYTQTSKPIMERHERRLKERQTKVRMIENPDKRIVNFIFTNPFPVRLNEFSNRLRKLFDNKLDEYVSATEERINSYIEKVKNDEHEYDEDNPTPYPIMYLDTTHLTIDVSSVGRIALATADDPFFKLPPNHKKFFPELVVYNKEGEIIETIDETKIDVETITKGSFDPDCRDSKLKLNDDRRASLSLLTQKDVQMVLLVIRSKDLYQQTDIKSNEFDRAQFRLVDDNTNQTLDTALIKDIEITLPTPEGEGDEEEQQPEPEEDEEEEKKGPQPQNVIVVGRIHLEGDRWIYEQYHYMFREDKYPDFFSKIGKIEAESRTYFADKEALIKAEEKALKEAKEAAAQAAAAKAASKKNKKKGTDKKKKEKEEKEEEKIEETKQEEVQDQIDIDYMPGFKTVLEGVHSTIFGPVNLELREEKFDLEKTEALIKKKMKNELLDKIENWKHGFEFKINGRVRPITRRNLLKYSRNAQNLQILPVVPPEQVVEEPKAEAEGEGEGEGNQE